MKVTVFLLNLLMTIPLQAQASENPFVIDLKYDVPLLGLSTLLLFGGQSQLERKESANYLDLEVSDLPEYEQWVTRQYSTEADLASDILSVGILTPLAFSFFQAKSERQWNILLTDALIFAQAVMLSSAINLNVRGLSSQPRPFVYSDKISFKKRAEPEASTSFYSGHTSAAFLTATYTSYVFQTKYPGSPWSKWIWLSSHTAAAGMGALRVAAGKHFIKDVAVGAFAGSLIGFLIPRIHLSKTTKLAIIGSPYSTSLAWHF